MNARNADSSMSARIAAALFAIAISSTTLAAVAVGLTGDNPATLAAVVLG